MALLYICMFKENAYIYLLHYLCGYCKKVQGYKEILHYAATFTTDALSGNNLRQLS